MYACAIKAQCIRTLHARYICACVCMRACVRTRTHGVEREQRNVTQHRSVHRVHGKLCSTGRWDSTDMGCHVRRAYASFGLLKNSLPLLLLLRYRAANFNALGWSSVYNERCDSDRQASVNQARLVNERARTRATERIRVQRIPRYAENHIFYAAGTVTLLRVDLSFPLLEYSAY